MKRIIIYNLKKFKEFLEKFKNDIKQGKISFETIAYFIMKETNFVFHELHQIFNINIINKSQELKRDKKNLDYDYKEYNKTNNTDEKNLYLYNYIIINLGKIFEEKENELKKQNNKIKINLPNIQTEQEDLLNTYYTIYEEKNNMKINQN